MNAHLFLLSVYINNIKKNKKDYKEKAKKPREVPEKVT